MDKVKEFGSDAARRWFFANLADNTSEKAYAQTGSAHAIQAYDKAQLLKTQNPFGQHIQSLKRRSEKLHDIALHHAQAAQAYQNAHAVTSDSTSRDRYAKLADQHSNSSISYKTRALNLDKAIARKANK